MSSCPMPEASRIRSVSADPVIWMSCSLADIGLTKVESPTWQQPAAHLTYIFCDSSTSSPNPLCANSGHSQRTKNAHPRHRGCEHRHQPRQRVRAGDQHERQPGHGEAPELAGPTGRAALCLDGPVILSVRLARAECPKNG